MREAQDRAPERADAVIRALAAQTQVQVRESPAQPFIGAVLRVDDSDEIGELPHRREIVTAWLGDQSALVEGVLHPAVVAIFEELETRGLSTRMDNVRQIVMPDGDVEVVTTLKTLGSP